MPEAPPRREAATRAARNILHQYTTPFGPRPTYVSKLGNTATRYDKVDRAYRSGGTGRRSKTEQGGGSAVGHAGGEEGTERMGGTRTTSTMASSNALGRREMKAEPRSAAIIESLMDYESGEDDTPRFPTMGTPLLVTTARKQVYKPHSSKRQSKEAASPSKSLKRKRADHPVQEQASSSRKHPSTRTQFARVTSPLTPKSSDKDIINPHGSYITPRPPSSDLSRIPTALPSRSISPPYPPLAPMLSWWAEISPQPPSSPPNDMLSGSVPASHLGLSIPAIHGQAEDEEELSNSATSRLTPMRWSPVSVPHSPLSDRDPRASVDRLRGWVPSPSDSDRPRATRSSTPEAPVIPHFRPRSQAFQGFSQTSRAAHVQSGLGSSRGSDGHLAELREEWKAYEVASDRFRTFMENLSRG